MSHIVFVGEFPNRNRNLLDKLRRVGFRVSRFLGGEDTLRFLKEEDADLIVVGRPADIHPQAYLKSLAGRFPQKRTLLLLDEPGGVTAEDRFIDLSGLSDEEIVEVLPGVRGQRPGKLSGVRLIGKSRAMEQVRHTTEQVAATLMTALITGESGTGKDVIARLIHEQSDRADAPFVAVNCAALPEGVLESELFGHEKGAFTGATGRRAGRFELADRGTLFLDEIGEMPVQTQAKLLRVLEEKRFLRVGGVKDVNVNVRLIAATNADLEDEVESGRFRKDLYYRLNVINIHLPPLRDRREDIPDLLDAFVQQTIDEHGLERIRISDSALAELSSYHWPGNVRQLKNVVEKMVILHPGGRIERSHISALLGERFSRSRNLPVPATPGGRLEAERELIYQTLLSIRQELAELKEIVMEDRRLRGAPQVSGIESRGKEGFPLDAEVVEVREENTPPPQPGKRTAAEFEKEAIRQALAEAKGNRRVAAEILGIGERTLYRKIAQYNLS